MVCHEVWSYNDDSKTATLVEFKILCPDCNFVHHIGRAQQIGKQDSAVAHMAAVNGITVSEARGIVHEAFEQWRARSKCEWRIAVAPTILGSAPEVERLVGVVGVPGEGTARAGGRA